MEAAREGHTEVGQSIGISSSIILQVCTLLVENAADVNAMTEDTHETPLILAAQNGHLQTCDVLLSLGALIGMVSLSASE